MEIETIQKAFTFLEKEKFFYRTVDYSENEGHYDYSFEDHRGWGHTIIFELENEKMEWYYFDSDNYDHIFSDMGRDLEETALWFQELVERAKRSFESLKRNMPVA